MEIYTIGFAGKSAETFFGLLRQAHIQRLIDIRLNNTSQLAGFTKAENLPFFLREILKADYVHDLSLAPTPEILKDYKKDKSVWQKFERDFLALLKKRSVAKNLDRHLFDVPAVLLCSEPKPDHCHRRILSEYLRDHWRNVKIIHL